MKQRLKHLCTLNKATKACQAGFVLPFVLAFSALFLFLLSHQLVYFVTKSTFYAEVNQRHELDYLLQKGIRDLQVDVRRHHFSQESDGSMTYDSGTVKYQVLRQAEDSVTIQVRCATNEGRQLIHTITFQRESGKVIAWV
ncbi:competence type IV pilus minor pilin ComGG [Priestia flexa]|uniref:competence type IV pilus minor pilin ComGG n=1 Tax=Priestia TaxID=2800373 RepID=UPI0021FCC8C7|nr:competence type IV pilus minor pilin ComGG [Priestia flexa]MDT2045486.1 competence type IV pilus minor pilin ComGG [Priestia flexa]USY54457.1 ComGG family competence protein [Bacillus sp. 1780r2a1]